MLLFFIVVSLLTTGEAMTLNCSAWDQPQSKDLGRIVIYNACRRSLAFVRQPPVPSGAIPSGAPAQLLRAGDKLVEPYEWFGYGGVSIKFANLSSLNDAQHFTWSSNITQFEYNVGATCLNVDISNVNAPPTPPFLMEGILWTSDDPNQEACGTKTCLPNATNCTAAYLYSTDDEKDFSCNPSTNIDIVLCPYKTIPSASKSNEQTTCSQAEYGF